MTFQTFQKSHTEITGKVLRTCKIVSQTKT